MNIKRAIPLTKKDMQGSVLENKNEGRVGIDSPCKIKKPKVKLRETDIKELHLTVKRRLKLKIHQKIKIASSWNQAKIKFPYVYQMIIQSTPWHSCL